MNSREIEQLIKEEENNLNSFLHLTANENVISEFVSQGLSGTFSNRYHLGQIDKFSDDDITYSNGNIYKGISAINKLERITSIILNNRLGGVDTDFRPLSGVHAMMCTILAVTEVNDYVLTVDPATGGHFATQNIIERTGRKALTVPLNRETLTLDYDFIAKMKDREKIKMFYIDDSFAFQPINFPLLKEILGQNTIIVYDASHPFGFIFAQQFMKPILEGCDILQANTHKIFPGPQKGIIHFANKALASKVKEEIGKSLVSSQHSHHTLALHLAILEMDEFCEAYAEKIIKNTRYLYNSLVEKGFSILEPFQKRELLTNQLYIKVPDGQNAEGIAQRFYSNNISINIRRIFDQTFLRIGLQEVTRLGFNEKEMDELAIIIEDVMFSRNKINISKSVENFELQERKMLFCYQVSKFSEEKLLVE
ncbi:PLP-dependent aminotransferase family protein [Flavobacterium pectinovorum]|uniref:Glycine hydroxymethyltransferase n=1 Tax=Flavobacterium pectinovorum TaxID=29533 RepID=A0AB36NTZ9_9FLAO|nr:hypothetical protein [Flavobacterium pectinovorum]OXA98970.1 hypothetical protein B0A72_22940 [Flavobacterium pectinovorum]SHN22359.1 glycine hydroxymethyltransferase [Flavobacterium pectinovorum]